MSKILKLKEWLSLEDAASHLSLIAETAVKPQDLVQFAIDGRIGLSLYLFTSVSACRASLVNTSDFLQWRVVDDFPSIEDLIENGAAVMDPTPTLIQTHVDQRGGLSGLVDIYQHKAYSTYEALYGLMEVHKPDDLTLMLPVEQNGKLYNLLSDDWSVDADLSLRATHTRIPEGAKLAIRVSELNRLEAELGSKPLDGRERVAYNNLVGALLDTVLNGKRWGQPVSTFADQDDVIKYLTENYQGRYGISERTLDDKFAAANEAIKGQ